MHIACRRIEDHVNRHSALVNRTSCVHGDEFATDGYML